MIEYTMGKLLSGLKDSFILSKQMVKTRNKTDEQRVGPIFTDGLKNLYGNLGCLGIVFGAMFLVCKELTHFQFEQILPTATAGALLVWGMIRDNGHRKKH